MSDMYAGTAQAQKRPKKAPKPKKDKKVVELVNITPDTLGGVLDELTTLRGRTMRNAAEMKGPRADLKRLKESVLEFCAVQYKGKEFKKDAYDVEHPEKDTANGREYTLTLTKTKCKPKPQEVMHEALVRFMRDNGNRVPTAVELEEEIEAIRDERATEKSGLKWVEAKKLEEKAKATISKALGPLPDTVAEVVAKDAYREVKKRKNGGAGTDEAPAAEAAAKKISVF
jgi:hypothetical protein